MLVFFIIQYLKITLVNIITNFILLSINVVESCQAHSARYVFKTLIFPWKLKFYLWLQMVSVILSWQANFIYFWKMCAR